MKTPFRLRATIVVTMLTTFALQLSASPLGTAFTYHGQLTQDGSPAEGIYDLRFAIYDSDDSSGWLGAITNVATEVSNGVFVATLDFGAGMFDGDARWLQISVRTNGSAAGFTALWPRQALTPTPYALYAPSAASAVSATTATVAANTEPNAVGNASLQAGSVTTDKILDGTISSADIGILDDLDINYYLHIGGDIELGYKWSALDWNRYFDGVDRYRADGYAGMLRQDGDSGGFHWLVAPSGTAGEVIDWNNVVRLSQEGNFGIGAWTPQARLEVRGEPRADNDEVPQLRLTGNGGSGAQSLLDLATYHPGTNAPAARIQATDDGNASAGVDILTKEPGALDHPLVSRLHIDADGAVGIGTTDPQATLDVNGGVRTGWIDLPGQWSAFNWNRYFDGTDRYRADGYAGMLQLNANDGGFQWSAASAGLAGEVIDWNVVRLSPEGHLGIGAWTPEARLEVRGNPRLDNDEVAQLRLTGGGYAGALSLLDLATYHPGTNAPAARIQALADNAYSAHVDILTKEPGANENPLLSRLHIAAGGNVGIGTSDPQATLHVAGNILTTGRLEVQGVVTTHDSSLNMYAADGSLSARLNGGDNGYLDLCTFDGVTGVAIAATDNGWMILRNTAGHNTIRLYGDYGGTGNSRIITDELEIRGGSDLSEQFDIQTAVEPGSVVCIDPENHGKLVVSSKAYDRTVAGIVSGAGGVLPGMMMGQSGTMADGEHPVALSGRVYCRVDASQDAIRPGDLLTTSDVPGHAMKATDHARAQGAILGKAMSSLDAGEGLVLVLVSLQ